MTFSSLELIIGPMFSGKTTELMRRVSRHKIINHSVLVVNSKNDSRCGDQIKSHDDNYIDAIKVDYLYELNDTLNAKNYDVIAIDEGQFFTDLINFLDNDSLSNIHLIISGLNGDSNQNIFGKIHELLPLATSIDLMKGLCTDCGDGTPSIYSVRLNMEDENQVLVGGKQLYKSVCRKHMLIHNQKIITQMTVFNKCIAIPY